MTADYMVSSLDKLLGRTPFDLAEHIVEEHIIPYVKYYLKNKSGISLEDMTPMKLLDEKDLFSQILSKIVKISEDVEYGIVVLTSSPPWKDEALRPLNPNFCKRGETTKIDCPAMKSMIIVIFISIPMLTY